MANKIAERTIQCVGIQSIWMKTFFFLKKQNKTKRKNETRNKSIVYNKQFIPMIQESRYKETIYNYKIRMRKFTTTIFVFSSDSNSPDWMRLLLHLRKFMTVMSGIYNFTMHSINCMAKQHSSIGTPSQMRNIKKAVEKKRVRVRYNKCNTFKRERKKNVSNHKFCKHFVCKTRRSSS